MSNPPNIPAITADHPLFRRDAAPVTPDLALTEGDALDVVERTVVTDGALHTITQVGGVTIGTVDGTILRVAVKQLQIVAGDDERERLRKGYDPDKDDKFTQLKRSIQHTGINVEPIICEVLRGRDGKSVLRDVEGQSLPVLLVRSGERRYHALSKLGLPEARVQVLPLDARAKEQFLLTLIRNDMREPLPLLDRCDLVLYLMEEYHLSQPTIAASLGYGTTQIWRYAMAARQPTAIRTYLAGKSLTLDAVEKLQEHYPDDEDGRVLAAMYIVQHADVLRGTKLDEFFNDVAPLDEGQAPHFAITTDAEREGRLALQPVGTPIPIVTPPSKKGGKATAEPLPYWKRGTPLLASPVRLLNYTHQVTVSGPASEPEVAMADLLSVKLLQEATQHHDQTVTLRKFEEAMLADLEAIRAALEEGDGAIAVQQPITKMAVVDSTARLVS